MKMSSGCYRKRKKTMKMMKTSRILATKNNKEASARKDLVFALDMRMKIKVKRRRSWSTSMKMRLLRQRRMPWLWVSGRLSRKDRRNDLIKIHT